MAPGTEPRALRARRTGTATTPTPTGGPSERAPLLDGPGGRGRRAGRGPRGGPGRAGPRGHGVAGLGALVVGGLVAVAAVQASTSTVTWPAVGALAQPTTLFLVPYRPATLDATVPCRAVRAALGRPAATTILATTTSEASTGLVIRSEPAVAGERPSELQVLVSGREVPVTVPAGDCTLRVVADAAGVPPDRRGPEPWTHPHPTR